MPWERVVGDRQSRQRFTEVAVQGILFIKSIHKSTYMKIFKIHNGNLHKVAALIKSNSLFVGGENMKEHSLHTRCFMSRELREVVVQE